MNDPNKTTLPAANRPTVTVVGQGRISAPPDVLVLHVRLKETRNIAYDAEMALKERRRSVREALESIGVEPQDMRNEGGASVCPDYRYNRDSFEFMGFKASEDIVLRMPLDKILQTDLLTALTPVNGKSYIQVTHELSNPGPIRLRALAAAVADARKKASVIAEAAGASLGDLIRLTHPPTSENGQGIHYAALKDSDAFSPEDQFEEAEIEAVWALQGTTGRNT